MQTISSILKIERGVGTWVDDVGSSTYTPSFPLGVLVTLAIDLRAPLADGAELPSLPAYPKSELDGLSLLFVMDLDYDQETIPPFIRTTGITLAEDTAGHLICSIPLPDTNTEAMRNALATAETQTFRCEIIGRNASGFDVFAVPFSMTVRNRVLLGEATETPDTDAADWIPTVDALLQEIVDQKAESLKGAPGADGSDGQSAYELWIAQGNSGTEEDFLASLKGDTGEKGEQGEKGDTGALTMGTVMTLESGEEATATITDGVLSLGIPTGPRGTDGFALCYAFSPVSDADSDQWHQSVMAEDIYWRISEDNGATWSAARRLEQAAVAPIARFSAVAQATDSVWVSPTQMDEYVQLPAGAAYFRIQCKGYPWTEPRLISATSGTANMTADEIAAAEATLKAASIRAQFSPDGAEWHAAITDGDLYVRFFSITGTVLARWSLESYGEAHSIQELQVSEAGAPWHETPKDGDKYMKISLDGGATWYAKCFQIQGEKGEKGDPGEGYTLPTASASTLGGVKVGTGLTIADDGTLSATSTGGSSSSSEAEWGKISGTLSDQSDLSSALAAKADTSALTAAQNTATAAQTTASAAQTTVSAHAANTAIHVPSSGTTGQVLTKTTSGAAWQDASATGEDYTLPAATASTLGGVKVGTGLSVSEDGTLSASLTTGGEGIAEFDNPSREWTKDDVGKLFRYVGYTTGQWFYKRLYMGVQWKEGFAGGGDSVISEDSSDTGDTSQTVVSYVVVATFELSGYSGTYTLTSGTDGSTDAIYTGDNGKYMWYGKNYAGTSCWVCGSSVNAGAAPTSDPYIYSATDSITGAWYKSDSDYSGSVTSVTRQETTGTTNSTSNASTTSSSSSTEEDAYPDWPLTFTVSGPVTNAVTGEEIASTDSTYYPKYAQAFGTYYRTGNTFTTCGEAVPIWTNGTCYIHAIQYSSSLTENTEPTIGLFIPNVGGTYTPTYEYTRNTTTPLYRLKSAVTRPTSGTITTEDSSDGVPSSTNGDLWACVQMVDLTIKETYSSTDETEDPKPLGNTPFSDLFFGASPVSVAASREWSDEAIGLETFDTMNGEGGNNHPEALTCYPGGRYYANVAADSSRTINAGTYAGPPLAECEVVLKMAAGSSVSCGSSITLRGSLVAGQVNFCRLVWTGNSAATLIVQ